MNKLLCAGLILGLIVFVTSCSTTAETRQETGTATAPVSTKSGVWTGIFIEGAPADMSLVANLEAELGRPFASVMWFADFSNPFPTAEAEAASQAGALPNITWEPWLWSDKKAITLKDIVSGKLDDYITNWGKGAAAFGKPVMVRWGHEFNGDWYPWAVSQNGQDPALYIAAYRRVHDLVSKAGADNILWVWCPNNQSAPAAAWNNPFLAYPGSDVVDWVAFDGYDFDGTSTFADLFTRIYTEAVRTLDKPMFVGEFATGRTGSAKAQWIHDMRGALVNQFPAIKGIVWFDIKKERDWRLEESPESLQAAVSVFSGAPFLSDRESIDRLARDYGTFLTEYRDATKDIATVERKTVNVPRISAQTPGDNDWAAVSAISFDSQGGLSGTVRMTWNAEYLFIRAEIADTNPMVNAKNKDAIWNGDCFELCLSTDPTVSPERAYFAATDWQLGFAPADSVAGLPERTWEWSKLRSPVPGATVVSHAVGGGYRMDISVPWSALGGFSPSAGMRLGFDMAIDQAGADGNRNFQWVWNGNASFYNDPNQWGVLALVSD